MASKAASYFVSLKRISTEMIESRGRLPANGSSPSGLATLVPELLVNSLEESLLFWRDLLGFTVSYDRMPRFAFLDRHGAHIMICERNGLWETGDMTQPLGQGVNFQIYVDSVAAILKALKAANWPLYVDPKHSWYRAGHVEIGQYEFLVQDPDGYLVRLAEFLGTREPLE